MHHVRRISIVLAIIFIVGSAAYGVLQYRAAQPTVPEPEPTNPAPDLANLTYTVDGRVVVLRNGVARQTFPHSSLETVTQLSSLRGYGDLDNNGTADGVAILTDDPGGSGTFYYLVAGVWGPDGPQGSAAIFLGDRITIRSLDISGGVVTVRWLDRQRDEPLATAPSVPAQRAFRLDARTRQLVTNDQPPRQQ